jgi:hypothetical protein
LQPINPDRRDWPHTARTPVGCTMLDLLLLAMMMLAGALSFP